VRGNFAANLSGAKVVMNRWLENLRNWAREIELSPLVTEEGDSQLFTPATRRKIKAEQIQLLYQMDRGSGVKPVVAFLATTWLIAGFSSAIPWAAAALYCAAWTGLHMLQLDFERAKNARANPEAWAEWFTIASFCTGLAWGFGTITWFNPADVGNQAIVSLVIIGVATSSVISRSLHAQASLAFLVPGASPVVLSLLAAGNIYSFVVGCLGAILMLGLWQWTKTLRVWNRDSIALRYQNEALVKSLSVQRRDAEQARREAEKASRTKSEFLATMSHEVRTPLNGILGMAQVLQTSELKSDQKDYLDVIVDSGELLGSILNDVLDLSKMEAGHLELEATTFDARDTAETIVRLLDATASAKGLSLELSAPDADALAVSGDMHRVRQILMNLIGNAIKFTETGSVTVAIAPSGSLVLPAAVRAAGNASTLTFAVSDTGIGISPSARESLFEPFRQADQSTTRRFGGTGLGLTICRRLVTLMGGEIDVTSDLGKGSTFWFTLPTHGACEKTERAAS